MEDQTDATENQLKDQQEKLRGLEVSCEAGQRKASQLQKDCDQLSQKLAEIKATYAETKKELDDTLKSIEEV